MLVVLNYHTVINVKRALIYKPFTAVIAKCIHVIYCMSTKTNMLHAHIVIKGTIM